MAVSPPAAGAVRILAPAAGDILIAGQLVDVRWEGLPADVDEMELLLEVDRSAAWHLRLTPELAATTRTYPWRVPNLPGSRATLRLRWGRDGVETEGEPSAPFRIEVDPRAPLAGARFRSGEWWIAESSAAALPPWSTLAGVPGLAVGHLQPATTSEGSECLSEGMAPRLQRTGSHHRPRRGPAVGRPHTTVRCPVTAPLRP